MRFTPDQVLEIEGIIEKTVLSRMAENTARDFTAEELEEINIKIKYFCALLPVLLLRLRTLSHVVASSLSLATTF